MEDELEQVWEQGREKEGCYDSGDELDIEQVHEQEGVVDEQGHGQEGGDSDDGLEVEQGHEQEGGCGGDGLEVQHGGKGVKECEQRS